MDGSLVCAVWEPLVDSNVIAAVVGVFIVAVSACALKGKPGMAIGGMLIGGLAIIGAIRLAKPDSFWARKHYPPDGEKMRVARLRFDDPHRGLAAENLDRRQEYEAAR